MEKNSHSVHSRPTPGGLIRLQARLADPATWLGPAWAMLCGVIASSGFCWQGADWLRIALLVLLVDGCWGTLWAALGSTNWAAPLRQWRTWEFGERTPKPPYTLPDSPGDRMLSWIGLFRAWWRHLFWLDCGPAISAIIITLPMMVLLGTLLGQEMLLLSTAAVAAMQAGTIGSRGHGTTAPEWHALVGVALPWLAGHAAFGPLTPSSSVLALILAMAWGGAWRVESPRGRFLAAGGQLLAAAILVALGQPLAACGLVLLSIPKLVLLPWIGRGQPAGWYVRHTRPWLMAAMLIAAWAL